MVFRVFQAKNTLPPSPYLFSVQGDACEAFRQGLPCIFAGFHVEAFEFSFVGALAFEIVDSMKDVLALV